MIALDTNILLYARREELPHHREAFALLTRLASCGPLIGTLPGFPACERGTRSPIRPDFTARRAPDQRSSTVVSTAPPFTAEYRTVIWPEPRTRYSMVRVVRPGCPLRTRIRFNSS